MKAKEKKVKIPKTGLFIDQAKNGEWFWHLKASNGKVTAGNGGMNSKQLVMRTIVSTARYFSGETTLFVYDMTKKKYIHKAFYN